MNNTTQSLKAIKDILPNSILTCTPFYFINVPINAFNKVSTPICVAYVAYKHYYDTSLENPQKNDIQKTTEGDLWKSFTHAFPSIIQDTLFVDGITYSVVFGASKALVALGMLSAAPAAIWVGYATLGALVGYTIRRTCNNYYNEGENNWICGFIGGAVKYGIKANPLSLLKQGIDYGAKEMFIGGINNALYEYNASKMKEYAKDNSALGHLYSIYSIFKIENMDSVLSNILKGANYNQEFIISIIASISMYVNGKITVPYVDDYIDYINATDHIDYEYFSWW